MHMKRIVDSLNKRWNAWLDKYYQSKVGPYQDMPPRVAYDALTHDARQTTLIAGIVTVVALTLYGKLYYTPIATFYGTNSLATWGSAIPVFLTAFYTGFKHVVNEYVLRRFAEEHPDEGIPGPISSRIADFLSKL